MNSIFERRHRSSDKILNFLIQLSSALSVLILVVCIGYIYIVDYHTLIFHI